MATAKTRAWDDTRYIPGVALEFFKAAGKPEKAAVGHTFFAELSQTIDSRLSSEPEAAVLEAYAVCLAFGFRGKYEAHDIEGYEAMRARLNDKLRRSLAVPVELPVAVPASWPQQRSLHALLLWIGGLSVLFAAAMLLTYHLVLVADASALRQRLGELLTATS